MDGIEKKTFGSPLDLHTEEHGIETELGPSYIPNKRIPLIIEDAIRCLQEKGRREFGFLE
jgi:hypothetical protein